MVMTYRGGNVRECGSCGRPVIEYRYEDPDEPWAQLFEYECPHCGYRHHYEDFDGWDVYPDSPLYRGKEKGEASVACPRCATGYPATLLLTTELRWGNPVRRFETLQGTCSACGLAYDARRDGMDLGHESGTDERIG